MTTYTSEPGTRLGGRYRLEDRIAAGSGWAAWKAIDETLARAVTVFTFAQGFPRVADVVTAARAASRLTDPRLAHVFDVEDAWERAYIVMEWAAGETLGDMVAQGPLEPFRAGRMITQVAAALSSAHAAGVAHMCLSPGSVRWSQTGEVKVVGLGIDAALSGVGADDPVLADTVGLGRLLYTALTGYWPGHDYPSLPAAPMADGQPCSPHQVVAGVPLALSDITCQAMQSRSRDGGRLSTPDQLARALIGAAPPASPTRMDPGDWRQDAARRERGTAPGEFNYGRGGANADRSRHAAPGERRAEDRVRSADTSAEPGRRRAGRHGSRHAGRPVRAADEALGVGRDGWRDGPGGTGATGVTGPLPRLRQALSGAPVRKPVAIAAAGGVLVLLAVAAFALLPGGGGSPSVRASNNPTTPANTVAVLHVATASGFDPLTSPKLDRNNENSQFARYAIDGDPRTAWDSQYYRTATFGGLKQGSGLILDMGKVVTATSVTVTFGSSPGAEVQLLVGSSATLSRANLDSMTTVATATSPTGSYPFSIAKPHPGRFLVIWFTKLPPKPGSKWFMAQVFNVTVKGTG